MYIVTVQFTAAPPHAAAFTAAMHEQARNSLEREPGCRQFDVCFDAQHPERCFLYEKYDDRAAFDLHLASAHFKAFDAKVAPWVVGKDVQTWTQPQPQPHG